MRTVLSFPVILANRAVFEISTSLLTCWSPELWTKTFTDLVHKIKRLLTEADKAARALYCKRALLLSIRSKSISLTVLQLRLEPFERHPE